MNQQRMLQAGHMLPIGLGYATSSCLSTIANFVWQYRKPSWWLVLADDKSNRVVVPPMKITDVPFSIPEQDRDYRSYKLQFQAPNGVGLFTWKVYLVSDTFVGEEICEDIAVRVIHLARLIQLIFLYIAAQN
jgi:preprotein translocase subunit Sec63